MVGDDCKWLDMAFRIAADGLGWLQMVGDDKK